MPRNFTDKSLWLGGNIQINNINVASLGEYSLVAPGSIPYGSQDDWGKRVELSNAEITNYTNTTNGTLFGALYQLVQVHASASASNVQTGRVAFLKNQAAGSNVPVVTDEAQADADSLVAGVFLNAITPGNYGAICVGGKVNVKYYTTLTVATPAVGDLVGTGAGNGTVDDIAAHSGNVTGRVIGVAVATAPTAGSTLPIRLRPICYQV